jgi:hypothetical protein
MVAVTEKEPGMMMKPDRRPITLQHCCIERIICKGSIFYSENKNKEDLKNR